MTECIFCKIVTKELHSEIEFENERVIAFKNIHPIAEIHTLIVPKEHVATFLDVHDAQLLFEMTAAAQHLIKKHDIEGGYKLVFNGGKYQAIKHLHWHLLGGKLEDSEDLINNT